MASLLAEGSIWLQVQNVRSELKEKITRAHQMLEERERELLLQLQNIEDRLFGHILELSQLKEHTVKTLKKAENKKILEQSMTLLDTHMRELEANLNTTRDGVDRVEFLWDVNLEEILNGIGSIQLLGNQEYLEREHQLTVTDKPTKNGKRSPKSITKSEPTRGLRNTRNTCYMNSTLQCLSHTLPLREFYVSDEYKQFLNKRGDLSSAFKRVMLELLDSTSQHSVDPYDLRREVKARTDRFPDYRQHDAHEFMRFLLNELHEEINKASVEGRKSPADNETLGEACARHLTWENSRISELFGGMLRSEVCCSVCFDKSIMYIPFMDIALPIQKTTEKSDYHYSSSSDPSVQFDTCLEIFTAEETLDGEERPYCNKCQILTQSAKRLFISKLPKFLVIQLKRFSGAHTRTKLSTHVEFNENWKLEDTEFKIHTYSLYGIVCHSGTLYSGHYIAYCRCGSEGEWQCFDDATTCSVSWEHVKAQEVYILFYKEENVS